MKNPDSTTTPHAPKNFEPRLRAYSSTSAVVVAIAAAAAAKASAQGIVNLTSNNLITVQGTQPLMVPNSVGTAQSLFRFAIAGFSGPTNQLYLNATHIVSHRPAGTFTSHVVGFGFNAGSGQDTAPRFSPGKQIQYYIPGTDYYGRPKGGELMRGNSHRQVGGNFPTGGAGHATGYVGFALKGPPAAGTHPVKYYGWLRLQVLGDGNGWPVSVQLKADANGIYGAYSTDVTTNLVGASGVSGVAPIAAGVTAIPEPASVASGLALFALGAAGVRESRKRRAADQSANSTST